MLRAASCCCCCHNASACCESSRAFDLTPACRSPLAGHTQIKLGTLDQPHAENEYVLRSYTRSAKKAKLAAAEEEEQ